MSNSEKVALGTTLAGVNQYKVFSAIMNNFDQAVNATNEAMNSQGATARQNEIYMSSLEAKTKELKQAFEQLVLGEGGLLSIAKTFVTLATNVLKFINTIGGLPTILTTIAGILIYIKGIAIYDKIYALAGAIKTLVIPALKNLGLSLKNALVTYIDFSLGMASANQLMQASIPVIGLLLTAIGGLIAGINAHNKKQDELRQKQKEELDNLYKELDGLNKAIDTIKTETLTREQLNSILSENIKYYDGSIDKIEDENEARKKALELLEEEQKLRAQEVVSTGQTEYEQARKTLQGSENREQNYSKKMGLYTTQTTSITAEMSDQLGQQYADIFSGDKTLTEEIDAWKQWQKVLIETRSTMKQMGFDEESEDFKKITKDIETTETQIADLTEQYKNANEIVSKFDNALYVLGQTYDDETNSVRDLTEGEKIQIRNLKEIAENGKAEIERRKQEKDALEELKKYYNITDEAIQDYLVTHDGLTEEDALYALIEEAETIEDLTNRIKELNTTIDNLQSGMSSARKAQEEYNKYGKLNLDTFQELINIDGEYLSALVDENGQIQINKETLDKLVVSLKEAKIAELKESASKEVSAYLSSQLSTKTDEASDSMTELATEAEATSKSLIKEAVAAELLKDGITDTELQDQGVQNILDKYERIAQSINNAVVTTDDLTTSTKGASNATKELQDQYKIAITYIEEMYEKQKSLIEETKNAELDAIDKQIDALQAQKDAREKYWDDLINKLKDENDQRQKSIDLLEKQEALERAKAQKVKVFRDGEFVYEQDETAVSKAEQDLYEYQQKLAYEEELDRLEKQKQAEMDNFDKRIANLQAYRAQKEAEYKKQLELIEKEKQAFKDQVDDYENQQKRLVTAQLLGIDEQQLNWNTMLQNLQTFVGNWNRTLGKMDGNPNVTVGAKSTGDNYVNAYANGVNSVGDYEASIVGENPKYRELVIGSKLNTDQGVLMSLKRGSGVVNAEKTNTLAGLFNGLSSFATNNFGRANGSLTNNTSNSSITIGNINLPNVSNGSEFVSYLQNFSLDLLQTAY